MVAGTMFHKFEVNGEIKLFNANTNTLREASEKAEAMDANAKYIGIAYKF